MIKTLIITAYVTVTILSVLSPPPKSASVAQVKAPSGTPSTQPGPANPTPRPSDPQPDPKNPQGEPGRDTPKPDVPPDTKDKRDNPPPGDPADRMRDQRDSNERKAAARNSRPFAFQAPELEQRFNESAVRLVRLEEKMKTRQADALKRLGEVRTMPADRQNAALFDLLQQMLQDQAEINDYLVQSRTAWSGEVDLPTDREQTTDARRDAGSTPEQPRRGR